MLADREREHIFISYAWEDAHLAEWLSLKLTAQGYKVWCDQIKLLGGESYPSDIDNAIKNNTFRVLALLSKHSVLKTNPKKERTLALNIARERKVDFLIPLNVDGLSPTELDWMTSDLTFISFSTSWAQGLKRVLKKLSSIDAPRTLPGGKEAVCEWFSIRDTPIQKEERLWTNLLPITEIPRGVDRFEILNEIDLDAVSDKWPLYIQSPQVVWSFSEPHPDLGVNVKRTASVAWEDVLNYEGMNMRNVTTSLIKRSLVAYCLSRGMKQEPTKKYRLYFPEGMFPNNRLSFFNYKQKKVPISVAGERTFYSSGLKEKNRYHISPSFRPLLRDFNLPVIRVSIRVYLTDLNGNPLDTRKMLSRRKRLCKDWWNYEWLSRFMAVTEWLSNGQDTFNVLSTDNGNLLVSGCPITNKVFLGIDETAVEPIIADDDYRVIDEDSDLIDFPDDSVENMQDD
ncbi:MAG: hypothetical protein A2Z25_13405 [Planctomycetes bacterium RBG_16_55_9]|nr:MAG: hypothetical protein A2Z25_13405 [Planctomycetes bacterium RBG_16_55_9]